jgi:hypothetical protein
VLAALFLCSVNWFVPLVRYMIELNI